MDYDLISDDQEDKIFKQAIYAKVMKDILSELEKSNSVLLETDKLDEFWYYCSTLRNLYAFNYEYFENTVKITMSKDTILFQESKIID